MPLDRRVGSEVIPGSGDLAVECEVEIRLATSTLCQGLKSNLDLLLHSYNDSPSELSLTVCLLLFV